jgi:hypothetical protein
VLPASASGARARSASNAAALAAISAPAQPRAAAAAVALAAPAVAAVPPPVVAKPVVRVTFGPAGLARPLSRLDTARAAALVTSAHPNDTTIVVERRDDWQPGTRISIAASPTAPRGLTVAPREERSIVRIEPLPGAEHAAGTARMAVRLDQPLSYDHASGARAVPLRLVRARRYAGHRCRQPIERVDPARDGAASIASFASGIALAHGLSLHLTIERATSGPRLNRGDGWNFAARSDGFVETRLFAAVDDEPASEVSLAQLTLSAHGYELIDLRPVPAGLAADEPLARIQAAAASLAAGLAGDPALPVLEHAASLAGYPRAQRRLLLRLGELVHAQGSRLQASAATRFWLERLREAVASVGDHEPSRRQLTAISSALDGLAFAFTCPQPAQRAAPASPPPRKP